jgi:F0F1-type ATP synthase membrane subunit a
MAIITGLCIWLGSGLKVTNISRKQAVAEMGYNAIVNFVRGNMGTGFDHYIPLVCTIFITSVISNLISLVGITSRPFAVFSCLLAAALALLSLLNGILLVIHARQMNASGKRSRVKPYLWAILCFACTAAILFFQLYDFVRI